MKYRITIKSHLFNISMLLLMCLCTNITAQNSDEDQSEKHEMRLLVRPLPDSIMLRWAPTSYRLWLVGNKYGYRVTKTLMYKDGELLENRKTEMLTVNPLKPRPLAEWEKLDLKGDKYAGIAAQSIYGDSFVVDAGGSGQMSIMDIFNVATEQENRYGFALFAADQSIEVAQHHGLMIIDTDVKKGEKYLYKVFPDTVPSDMKKDTAYFFTGVDEYLPLPKPGLLKAESADGIVNLTWDNKYQSNYFNSYFIERSNDGGKTYNRLNETPTINTTPEGYDDAPYHYYMDTIPSNEVEYTYRVIGISMFGELGPPSDPVNIKGVNQITTVPRITKKYSNDGRTVVLEWEFPNDKAEVVEGFRIYRSAEYSKGFKLIADSISVMSRSYTDTQPLATGYYRMQAFNKGFDGNYSIAQMMQVVDSIPPVKPNSLQAEADTSGQVRIWWKGNEDADIYGYRIYRANAMHEEFTPLVPRPFSDTLYIDTITLKTLTKKVYYKIRAFDQTQNQSVFSDVLEVDRPDIVPPASPLIRSIMPSDSGIVLNWANSPSVDVEKMLLYRNKEGSRDWNLIKVMPQDSTTTLLDVPDTPGFVYSYILIAVDEAGNESEVLKPSAAKYNPSINKTRWLTPKVKSNKKEATIILSWEMPGYPVNRFLIYVRPPKGKWQMVDGVEGNQFKYESKYYFNKDLEFMIQAK